MSFPLAGRQVIFRTNTERIACRTKSIKINNEAIDISDDDDNGFRTLLLNQPQVRSIDMDVEGVMKHPSLFEAAIDGGITFQDCTLEFPTVGTISGDFWFGNLSLGAPYNDAVTFTATFQSSGEFLYVEASS